jgi:DNA mismatch endonuclease, patch repair protein
MTLRKSDVFDPMTRSRIMAAVRTKGTEPELLLGRLLGRVRVRFRSNARELPGTPDFVLASSRTAIFVDGDFWHGRQWFESGIAPNQNRTFWIAKFKINRARDLRAERLLRRRGWAVIRFWASDLRKAPDDALELILRKHRTRRAQMLGCRPRGSSSIQHRALK